MPNDSKLMYWMDHFRRDPTAHPSDVWLHALYATTDPMRFGQVRLERVRYEGTDVVWIPPQVRRDDLEYEVVEDLVPLFVTLLFEAVRQEPTPPLNSRRDVMIQRLVQALGEPINGAYLPDALQDLNQRWERYGGIMEPKADPLESCTYKPLPPKTEPQLPSPSQMRELMGVPTEYLFVQGDDGEERLVHAALRLEAASRELANAAAPKFEDTAPYKAMLPDPCVRAILQHWRDLERPDELKVRTPRIGDGAATRAHVDELLKDGWDPESVEAQGDLTQIVASLSLKDPPTGGWEAATPYPHGYTLSPEPVRQLCQGDFTPAKPPVKLQTDILNREIQRDLERIFRKEVSAWSSRTQEGLGTLIERLQTALPGWKVKADTSCHDRVKIQIDAPDLLEALHPGTQVLAAGPAAEVAPKAPKKAATLMPRYVTHVKDPSTTVPVDPIEAIFNDEYRHHHVATNDEDAAKVRERLRTRLQDALPGWRATFEDRGRDLFTLVILGPGTFQPTTCGHVSGTPLKPKGAAWNFYIRDAQSVQLIVPCVICGDRYATCAHLAPTSERNAMNPAFVENVEIGSTLAQAKRYNHLLEVLNTRLEDPDGLRVALAELGLQGSLEVGERYARIGACHLDPRRGEDFYFRVTYYILRHPNVVPPGRLLKVLRLHLAGMPKRTEDPRHYRDLAEM